MLQERTTIAAGASLSGSIHKGAARFVAVYAPSGWDAAGMTFQGSYDNVTWFDVQDAAGAEVTAATVAASQVIVVEGLAPIPYIKIRSGTVGSPTNQVDEVTIVVTAW